MILIIILCDQIDTHDYSMTMDYLNTVEDGFSNQLKGKALE